MLNVDIQKKIFVHLKNVSVFETFKKLEDRFLDTLLFDNTLFGRVFSSNAEEVYEFLKEKANSAGIATGLSEREFMALRLIGYANDIGWLKSLAEFIAKDAAKIEMIEQAHTISKVCSAFDKAMKRPDKPPLWSFSGGQLQASRCEAIGRRGWRARGSARRRVAKRTSKRSRCRVGVGICHAPRRGRWWHTRVETVKRDRLVRKITTSGAGDSSMGCTRR
jgi:hypothetical protein